MSNVETRNTKQLNDNRMTTELNRNGRKEGRQSAEGRSRQLTIVDNQQDGILENSLPKAKGKKQNLQ